MTRKLKLTILVFFVVIFCFTGFVVYYMGLHDFIPVLRTSAQSPNGEITVEVYQQRLFPRPFFPRMGAIAKVYNKQGNLVFDEVIYTDNDFDDTVGEAYKHISFVEDEIQISPGPYIRDRPFIIKISNLKNE